MSKRRRMYTEQIIFNSALSVAQIEELLNENLKYFGIILESPVVVKIS